MQPGSYDSLRNALVKVGLVGQMQNEDLLVVSECLTGAHGAGR
jgi:hypothetical protein